jgi:indole-3-glycerol phosphate synthase
MLINLKKSGFNGFLIGERFMRDPNPGKACSQFINRVKEIE